MPSAHKFVQHVATANVSVLAMDEISDVTVTAAIMQLMPVAERRVMYIGVKERLRMILSFADSPTLNSQRADRATRDRQVFPHSTQARHSTMVSPTKYYMAINQEEGIVL
jgi:hypothetical protein